MVRYAGNDRLSKGLLTWATLLLAMALTSCSGANGAMDSSASAAAAIDRRLEGVWRLTSYVPDEQLAPALMASLQMEAIVVRFGSGTVRTQSTALKFERRYRVASVADTTFKLFIIDDAGVEYESHCELDQAGRILFRTVTAPWRGRGVLERQGPAMSR